MFSAFFGQCDKKETLLKKIDFCKIISCFLVKTTCSHAKKLTITLTFMFRRVIILTYSATKTTEVKAMELLKDKVALVTGGTRGIGYAIVRTFLENKAKVVLCGSRPETAQKAVDELKKENAGFEVEGISPDLTSYESVAKAVEEIKAKYGKIDILVNNAGISASEPLYSYEPNDFDKIMKLNVNSCFYTIRAVAPIMKENGGGVILNTSSMVSIYGQPAGVGYPTSKFALNGMTKSLARELAKDNIRVNAVAPGVTDTDMVAALPEQTRQYITSTIPLGRIGTPQDIANAFLFLASPLASYVTGEVLSVDGCARA